MNRLGHKLGCVVQHPSIIVYALSHPNIDSLLCRYWILEKSWMPKMLKELDEVELSGIGWSEFSEEILKKRVPQFESRYREAAYYAALNLSIRWLNPRACIETGVSLGFSSWSILEAFHTKNGNTLISIDLPREMYKADRYGHSEEFRPSDQVGSVVPSELRENWRLILGDSKLLLPKVLSELQELDFFLHDSEHSYDHMKFEFSLAYSKLRKGGLLFSDDVDGNSAFDDFCADKKLDHLILDKTANKSKFGIAIKRD